MKKISLIFIMVCLVLMAAGCTPANKFDGSEMLSEAKRLFEEMDSGRITITDNADGSAVRTFVFGYDSRDRLKYTYTAVDDNGEMFYEYHNGSELIRCTDSAGEWTVIADGTADYYSYNRKVRSSYTSASMLAFFDSCVTQSAVEQTASGSRITLGYDIKALNELGAVSPELGEITEFAETAEFNEDGCCTQLTQTGKTSIDGKETEYSYTIIIDNINSVPSVERPVPEWEKNGSGENTQN